MKNLFIIIFRLLMNIFSFLILNFLVITEIENTKECEKNPMLYSFIKG